MTGASFVQRHFLTQDGLRLAYRDYDPSVGNHAPGEGHGATPLLCLSGITRNAADFNALAQAHGKDRRMVCLDYRGRGESEYAEDWRTYTPETYVNDIRHLVVATGLHRFIIVGTSLGGLLSMALGTIMPSALAGIVLNDVGPQIESGATTAIVDYVGTDRPVDDWPAAVAAVKERFVGFDAWTDEIFEEVARGTYREGDDGRLHFNWDTKLVEPIRQDTGATHDLWAFFRSLHHVPVLALRGGNSDLLSEAGLQAMLDDHPDITGVTVPGVGHVPRFHEPAAADAMAAFLEKVDEREKGAHA